MGADFIGGAVEVETDREGALFNLKSMSDEELLATFDDQIEEGLIEVDNADELRDISTEAINAVYDCFNGRRRDGDVWKFHDSLYVVSGGLSWGDTPTDLLEAIWIVDCLGVTKV